MKQNEMAGRRFIGCELDPGYYETARRRIAEAGSDTENAAGQTPAAHKETT